MADDDVKKHAMQQLAESMIASGCEAVIGIARDGNGVVVVGDDMSQEELADMLITLASAIRRYDDNDVIARVQVEVDDDQPPPAWK